MTAENWAACLQFCLCTDHPDLMLGREESINNQNAKFPTFSYLFKRVDSDFELDPETKKFRTIPKTDLFYLSRINAMRRARSLSGRKLKAGPALPSIDTTPDTISDTTPVSTPLSETAPWSAMHRAPVTGTSMA